MYKVVFANVYFSGTGFSNVIMANLNSSSLKELEQYFNRIVAGSVVTFDNIRITKKDGTGMMTIAYRSFAFYDTEEGVKNNISLNLSGINDHRIEISKLKDITELKCSEPDYKINSATVYFSGEGFPGVVQTSINNGSLQSLDKYMQLITAGTILTFDNVFISRKKGEDKFEISGKAFGFYDKNKPALNTDTIPDKLFTKVEQEPDFPGGKAGWQEYLKKNINAAMPVDEGWKPGTYTIIVNFIVDKNGTVSDVSTNDFKNSKTAQQCINLVKNGPKWIPAKQNGLIVKAYRKQPITFVVSEN